MASRRPPDRLAPPDQEPSHAEIKAPAKAGRESREPSRTRKAREVVVIDGEARKCSVPVFPRKITEDSVVVRIKRRLGMYSMGQARYSRKSLERKALKPVRAIIHCAADDAILGPLARADGIEIVVD